MELEHRGLAWSGPVPASKLPHLPTVLPLRLTVIICLEETGLWTQARSHSLPILSSAEMKRGIMIQRKAPTESTKTEIKPVIQR